jgi:signal transduction histidine kinase
VLTNALQILRLPPDLAKEGLSARLHGVVTFYEHGSVLFVQDPTAGVFVYYQGNRLSIQPGDFVKVVGRAKPGRYSPIIDEPSIEPAPSGPPIQPRPSSLAQIYLGGLDAQWVELVAVARGVVATDHWLGLDLVDPPHRITVWIDEHEGPAKAPVPGSLVRVRGVVGTLSERGRLEGFQIFANTSADVTVIERGPADLFLAPLRPVGELRAHAGRSLGAGPLRVRGTVIHSRSGRVLYLQDESGGLEVRTRAAVDALEPGTVVEAAGFPGPVLQPPVLEDAQVRLLATNAPPEALRLEGAGLFNEQHDSRLVTLEGIYQGMGNSTSNTQAVILQSGGFLISATMEAARPPDAWLALASGTRLRVTGVCRAGGEIRKGASAAVLLRVPSDLTVLGRPAAPRSAGSQAAVAAFVLLGGALGVALWALYRQRSRAEHTLQLQVALQAEMREGEQQLRRAIEERERIGRDLHDDIIQSIYAVGLSLENCRRIVRESPQQAEPRLVSAIHTLNNTIRSVRGFITGLEPKVLNGREFKTALKSLALTSGDGPTQFQIEVDPAAANRLTSTQATQLLHIAKEAMSNCLRHARASNVAVSLVPAGPDIRLEIRDDGVGFEPGAATGGGQGLKNMSARAGEIGASVQFVSATGRGCCILVTVPQGNSNGSG